MFVPRPPSYRSPSTYSPAPLSEGISCGILMPGSLDTVPWVISSRINGRRIKLTTVVGSIGRQQEGLRAFVDAGGERGGNLSW